MKEITEFFTKLFDSSDWPPRWHCGKWSDFHGWLYIISDLLIWAAYFAIPVIIIRFITYKRHQRFIKLYFLFAAFILACGATHFLDAITFWVPLYRLNGLVRAITAIISWLTVFTLIKLLPYAFSLKPASLLEEEIEMRKKAEASLQKQNIELAKANKELQNHIVSVNEFNRIIGHNLRGPASSMINAADFLEKSDNEEDKKLLLSKMKSTSVLILNTINDLRDFLEIQLKHDPPKTPVAFNDALQNSLVMLQDQVQDSHAVINTAFGEESVVYPKVYLESLFYNLVSNAIKYCKPSITPVIDIETKNINNQVALIVKDNGIGINLDKYGNEIFKYRKIFHRGYDSNGVGLFLTKTQLDAYDADIEVSSKENEGTTFSIYFKRV